MPTDELTLTDPYDPLFTTGPGVAFVWPHEFDQSGAWSSHPPGLTYSRREGSTERGDLETDARLLYARLEATQSEDRGAPQARFGNGLALVDAQVTMPEDAAGPLIVESRVGGDRTGRPRRHRLLPSARRRPRTSLSATTRHSDRAGSRFRSGASATASSSGGSIEVPGGYDPARHTLITGLYEWPSTDPIPVTGRDGTPEGGYVVLAP